MERIPRPVRALLGIAVPLGLIVAPLATAHATAVAKTTKPPVKVRTASAKPAVRTAVTAPADGATVAGRVPFTAAASSAAGIARVEFRIDGVLRWTDKAAPWSFNGSGGTWNTAALADGVHTISATAFDRKGRSARDVHRVTVANVGDPAPPPAPPRAPEPAPAPAPAPPPAADIPAPPPPPASTAAVFLSPAGDDAAACTTAAPCRTIGRGFRAAAPGQVVEMAAGTYAGGTVAADPAKATATQRVVLRPASGAAVTVSSELNVNARHIEFRGMAMPGGWKTLEQAQDVVMRDIDAKHMFVLSSQDVSVLGGSVGPGVDYHPMIAATTSVPPRNVLVEGVRFHDWTRSNSTIHTECLQIGGGDGIVIRGNRFTNCQATGNMHVTHWGDSPRTRNVTIENNFFSTTTDGYFSVQAYAYDNLLIRNNSATQGFLIMPAGAMNNVRVIANVAPAGAWECVAGVTYRSNVWFHGSAQPAKCDATDLGVAAANPGFANPSALDLHLLAGSPAIGRGSATDGAATDIDGQSRGVAGAPDAGADEM
jgi:hypothetical protein